MDNVKVEREQLSAEYLATWYDTMETILAKMGGGDKEMVRKHIRVLLPTTEKLGVIVAAEAYKCGGKVHDFLAKVVDTGALYVSPVILEDNEEFEVPPMMQIGMSGYLSIFRGYRMQVSATPKGIGDNGSSHTSLQHDFETLRGLGERYAALPILAHSMQIVLKCGDDTAKEVRNAIDYHTNTFSDFWLKSLKYQSRGEFKYVPPVLWYFEGYEELKGYRAMQKFPIIGKNENKEFVFYGEIVVYDGAIGFQSANDKKVFGFHFTYTETDKQQYTLYMMYLWLLGYWLGFSNLYNANPITTLPGFSPTKYQSLIDGGKSYEIYSNFMRVEEYLYKQFKK